VSRAAPQRSVVLRRLQSAAQWAEPEKRRWGADRRLATRSVKAEVERCRSMVAEEARRAQDCHRSGKSFPAPPAGYRLVPSHRIEDSRIESLAFRTPVFRKILS
jgi:hypothetical protein